MIPVIESLLRSHSKNKLFDAENKIAEFLKHAPNQRGGNKFKVLDYNFKNSVHGLDFSLA